MAAPPAAVAAPRQQRQLGIFIRPLTLTAIVFLLLLVVAALLAPVIAPFGPNTNDLSAAFQHPSAAHWLGTDQLGRDILTRIMYGGRVSLRGVAQALAIYLVLGLCCGLLAGYLGGVMDSIVVWIANVSFAMPQIIVVLTVLAIFANNSSAAMLALGLLGSPGLAVFVRGATQSVRAEPYIAAARVSGLRTRQILVRHVLPRVAPPVIVQASLFAGTALLFQTGLDFLSLGTQPPTASWGSMVAEASMFVGRDVWMALPPGIVIALAIVAFGLLGDALNDRRIAVTGGSRTQASGPPRKVAPLTVPASDPAMDLQRAELASAPSSVLSVCGLSIDAMGPNPAPIVRNVSFDLARGECLGILGESGSGKTMTARGLIALLPEGVATTSGTITFEGRNLTELSPRELREIRGSGIGMISQEPIVSLDPSFSVGQLIGEVVRLRNPGSRRSVRQRTLELLEQVRLPDPVAVSKRFPHQLSGGMAQRVSIASALAAEPSVLIADEPTTALDVTVQAEILELLRQLRQERSLAMILVSHDWGVIADSCDRVVVMYAGEVVEEALIHEVFHRPQHPYSYGLMASNPDSATRRTALHAIRGTVLAAGQWPAGCHFAARCDFATRACSASRISITQVADHHWIRCIHPEAVPRLALDVVS